MSTHLAVVAALGRNRCMLRVVAAWLLFVVNEYAAWTAVLVYAFERHGTTGAAVAAVGQLLPAAACAPAVARYADRRSPTWSLRAGFAVQIGGLLLGATAMVGGAAALGGAAQPVAYAGAVVAATAVVAVRPAMALVVPGVARDAAEWGAANAVVGWLECVGTILAGVVVGVLLTVGGPGWVLVASAAALVVATVLVARVRVAGIAAPAAVSAVAPGGAGTGGSAGRVVLGSARLRVLVTVLTAGAVVVGALDVLFVVLAGDVLGRGIAWAGYLTTAYGIGGTLAVGVTVVVVGRGRLGGPVVAATGVLAVALAAAAAAASPVPMVALVTLAGGAHAVLDVTARTLVQRIVPPVLTGRVFGLVEAATMAAMAAGALLVPALDRIGGATAALLGAAVVGPLALASGGRVVRRLDDGRRESLVELSLLRQAPAFADVPTPALAGLAAAAVPVAVACGQAVPASLCRPDTVLVVAIGIAVRRADTGPPVTRSRGDLVDGGFVARTPLTLYRVDAPPVLTPRPAAGARAGLGGTRPPPARR